MFLRNMKIGMRLMAGFGIVILIGLVSALINDHSITAANDVAQQVKEQNFPYALLAEEMAFNTEAVQQFLTDVGATHDPEAFKEAEEAARSFREGIARFKVLYKGKNDPESVKKLEEIEGDFNSFYEQGKLMARAYVDEGTAAGNKIMRDFDKNSDNISGKVREFKKGQRDEANKVLQMLADSLVRTRALLWFLATCVVIMGMVVSWLITRSITRPVTEAVTFARAVAEGDFTKTIDVKGGGEIGDLTTALNAMVEGLNGMVRKIKESSGELTQVSRNIFDVSKRVIGAAAVQANGVQDTSSAIVGLRCPDGRFCTAGGAERQGRRCHIRRCPEGRRDGKGLCGGDRRGDQGDKALLGDNRGGDRHPFRKSGTDRRHPLGHRPGGGPDQPAGVERRHYCGPGRRARQGVCGGRGGDKSPRGADQQFHPRDRGSHQGGPE